MYVYCKVQCSYDCIRSYVCVFFSRHLQRSLLLTQTRGTCVGIPIIPSLTLVAGEYAAERI